MIFTRSFILYHLISDLSRGDRCIFMKNPNGYGSVTKMSGNRRKPFWVRKTIGWNEKGHPIYKTIGYCATREEGNMLLADYNKSPWDIDRAKITLQELFDLWLDKKSSKLGKANVSALKSAYKHINKLSSMKYKEIKSFHMQDCIDKCGRGYATQAAIKNLWGHLDRYALELDIISKCYSDLLTSDPIPQTSRECFTDTEIKRVWKVYEDYQAGKDFGSIPVEWIDTVLIFLYSGFRISELLTMKTENINLEQQIFKGGVKTNAGKNRIVPIHSAILPLVQSRLDASSEFFINVNGKPVSQSTYRAYWNSLMSYLEIDKTPHECRHTFESLLDSKGANRRCIDLMMGHVSKDVGNRVYNHKTIEELKSAIEILKVN